MPSPQYPTSRSIAGLFTTAWCNVSCARNARQAQLWPATIAHNSATYQGGPPATM